MAGGRGAGGGERDAGMEDDFEIEITDLRTGETPHRATDGRDLLVGPETREQPGLMRRGGSLSRRQIAGGAATVGLVALVLVALVGGAAARAGIVFGLFPTPSPTATLASGAGSFYLVHSVPWGKLLADGKPVVFTYMQREAVFFSLSSGRHAIEYDAMPFPKLTCVASVPVAHTDNCPIYTPPQGMTSDAPGPARGLDAGATLDHLPPDTRAALMAAVTQGLNTPVGSTTVPLGGRYQGAGGRVVIATEPIRAGLYYELDTNASDALVGPDGQPCGSVCDLEFGQQLPGPDFGWGLNASIVPIWRYTSSTGTTIELPATPPIASVVPSQTIVLLVSWHGSWQVTPSFSYGPDPTCFSAMIALQQSVVFNSWANGYSETQVTAPNPVDGCLLAFQSDNSAGQPTRGTVRFLYRFGLLLAANSNAHRYMPGLPVVTGSEAALAQKLGAQLTPPWNQ